MDDENVTQKALEKSRIYLENVIRGNTKSESRVLAGYSERSVALPQRTKAYKVALSELLDTNSGVMAHLLTNIEASVIKGAFDTLSPEKQVEMYKKMAEVHKMLTPQVTIKEEQLKDGSMKRTTWGQGSMQGNAKED